MTSRQCMVMAALTQAGVHGLTTLRHVFGLCRTDRSYKYEPHVEIHARCQQVRSHSSEIADRGTVDKRRAGGDTWPMQSKIQPRSGAAETSQAPPQVYNNVNLLASHVMKNVCRCFLDALFPTIIPLMLLGVLASIPDTHTPILKRHQAISPSNLEGGRREQSSKRKKGIVSRESEAGRCVRREMVYMISLRD